MSTLQDEQTEVLDKDTIEAYWHWLNDAGTHGLCGIKKNPEDTIVLHELQDKPLCPTCDVMEKLGER